MKFIKYLFAGIVIFLLVILPIFFDLYWSKDELILYLVSFGLMVFLSALFYKESINKIQSIFSLNIKFTRGLVYCLCSLPILYRYFDRPPDYPFLVWLIILYTLVLVFAIFNYGIEAKQVKEQGK